jgi:hypothetical protein
MSNTLQKALNASLRILSVAGCYVICAGQAMSADPAPSTLFDLHQWKLQIPGPKEIKSLKGYSSDYFHLNAQKELCFKLDAAKKGTTPNTHFVRSELRHLPVWKSSETRSMSAEVRVISHLKPDKVTVLQIHGITEANDDAPPLLRIAMQKGDLVAVIKTSPNGDKNDTLILKKGVRESFVKVDVSVHAGQLKIAVDHQEKVNRSLSFWAFPNYFKAGCYPQATEGTVEVIFRKLSAE